MFFKKKKDKLQENIQNENVLDSNFFENGTIKVLDLIKPEYFEEHKDYIYLGAGLYTRKFIIIAYPRNMHIGFFNDLYAIEGIDISNYVENIPDGEVISLLTEKYAKVKSSIQLKRNRGEMINYAEELAANDLDALRELIQTNKDRMSYTQTIISLWGKSIEDLDEKTVALKDICARKSLRIIPLVKDQVKAFKTSLPYMSINIKEHFRNMTVGATACMFPVGNTELMHGKGIYLGKNISSKAPVSLDNFAGPPHVTNPHLFVCGKAGAGKSSALKIISGRGYCNGEWIIILDPEEEYIKTIKNLGGQYIYLRAGQKTGINPFELEIEEDDKGNRSINLYEKYAEIRGMISSFTKLILNRPLQGSEIAKLEVCIRKIYADKEITNDPESLFEDVQIEKDGKFVLGKQKKALPILSDLKAELEKFESTQELAEGMELITGEGSMSMFDCQSNPQILSSKVIAFSLKHAGDIYSKFFGILNVMSWIWAKFSNWKYKKIHKRFIVDEGWLFAKEEETASFLEEMARRGRKYKISLCIGTQMIQEFLNSSSGEAVIHQCSTKLIMQQDVTLAPKTAEFFRLSKRCENMLGAFQTGQAFLKTEQEFLAFNVDVAPFERDLIET